MAKKKLERFAEMDILENVFQPKHDDLYQKDYRLKGNWKSEVFSNENPIVLEVGCGKGEYAVGLGEMFPDKNFVGIDIKGARMWIGAKATQKKGLKNVAFLRSYAQMLPSIFAPDEVDEIWITFPDPQMSKAKRRLTGTRFLNLYRQILKENGIVHLKTDSPFLYAYTSELIKLNNLNTFINTDDLYNGEVQDEILGIKTFYEQQWLLRGKTIKYIKFSLSRVGQLIEPDVKFEKDDYHSDTRYMTRINSNIKLD